LNIRKQQKTQGVYAKFSIVTYMYDKYNKTQQDKNCFTCIVLLYYWCH